MRPYGLRGVRVSLKYRLLAAAVAPAAARCTVFQRPQASRLTAAETLVFIQTKFRRKVQGKDHGSMPHASRIHRRTLGTGMLCRYCDFGFACLGRQSSLDASAGPHCQELFD